MRKEEILDAAREVFMKKGYNRATIDEIATKAGLAKGTLYLYFKNKEDLFISLLENQVSCIEELAHSIDAPDPSERLRLFAHEISKLDPPIHHILSYGQIPISKTFVRRMHKMMAERFGRITAIIAQWIKDGIKEEQFVKTKPEIAAVLFVTLSRSIVATRFFMDIKIDVDSVLKIFFDGLKRR